MRRGPHAMPRRVVPGAPVLEWTALPAAPSFERMQSAARAGRARRDALAPYSVFITDPSGDYYDLIRRFLEADGMPGPRLEATGSVESVKRAVFTDASALGILPAYALAEELRAERLISLDVRPAPPRLGVTAMVSRLRPPHPVARALVESVRESYRTVWRRDESRQRDE